MNRVSWKLFPILNPQSYLKIKELQETLLTKCEEFSYTEKSNKTQDTKHTYSYTNCAFTHPIPRVCYVNRSPGKSPYF